MVARWPPVRFSQLRSSKNRSPLSVLAAAAPPLRRSWFHSPRRTSSRASVAHEMTWKVSRQTIASGARSATTSRIQVGAVSRDELQRGGAFVAEGVEELADGGLASDPWRPTPPCR